MDTALALTRNLLEHGKSSVLSPMAVNAPDVLFDSSHSPVRFLDRPWFLIMVLMSQHVRCHRKKKLRHPQAAPPTQTGLCLWLGVKKMSNHSQVGRFFDKSLAIVLTGCALWLMTCLFYPPPLSEGGAKTLEISGFLIC